MVGNNRNKWRPSQVSLLERLIENGTSYEAAAVMCGHPVLSCRTKLSQLKAARRDAERQKPGETARRTAPRIPPMPPLIAKRPLAPLLPTATRDAPYMRATSTGKLLMDSELRSRIEVQGVTAGLLGDPLPGRSALDQMRAEKEVGLA